MARLEEAVLTGTGESGALKGISKTSGIQTQAFSSNSFESARKALSKLEAKEIVGGVYVLSIAHWEKLEITTTEEGEFIMNGPIDRAKQTLWGRPVIVSSVLTGKNGFLVDFDGSTQLWERASVRVDWSEAPEGSVENESAFKTNELIFRGEGRFGFGVTRPAGVVQFAVKS